MQLIPNLPLLTSVGIYRNKVRTASARSSKNGQSAFPQRRTGDVRRNWKSECVGRTDRKGISHSLKHLEQRAGDERSDRLVWISVGRQPREGL
jgi:hypothetical protein